MVGSVGATVSGAGGEAGQRLSAERDGLLGSGNWPSTTGPGLHKRADSYQPPRPAVKVFFISVCSF
jgi:hypothetical protein